eukprot:g17789.t1
MIKVEKSEKWWSKDSMKREDAARLLAEEPGDATDSSATESASESSSYAEESSSNQKSLPQKNLQKSLPQKNRQKSSSEQSSKAGSGEEEDEEESSSDDEEEDEQEEAKSNSKKRSRARSAATVVGWRLTKKLKAAYEEKQSTAQGHLERFYCSKCTAAFTSQLQLKRPPTAQGRQAGL